MHHVRSILARRRPAALATAALLAFALGSAAQATGALHRLEQSALQARFGVRHVPRPDDVAVVAIDDPSFSTLRQQWPFPRSLHARAIDRLRAAGAAEIVYDVQFTEPTKPAEDMALYDAVGRARNVVLATTEIDHGRTSVLGGDDNLARAHSQAAASNLPVEAGGVITHFPYSVDGLKSIATVTAERVTGRPVARSRFDGGRAWIDYRGGPQTIRTLHFSDVVRGHFDPAAVRGKVVVIGATTPSLQDVHATPMSSSRLMPGPEIQADAIWTVLHGVPLRGAPGWLAVVLIALLAALAPVARLLVRPLAAVGIAVAGLVAFAVAAQLLFDAGTIVSVVPPVVALLAGTVGMVGASYLGESRERTRVSRDNEQLDGLVRLRTRELRESELELIRRLGQAAELRDDQTGQHIDRMSHLCYRLARAIGFGEQEADLLRRAAALHDVGKIGIPDRILLKPGKLDADEWEVMKTHTTIGAEILSGSPSKLVQTAETIARTHHERWDGTGYPIGLSATDIPLVGRITSVCDVFDALVSKRPYKDGWSTEDALAEIRAQAGRQFDPELVELFLDVVAGGGEAGAGAVLQGPRPLDEELASTLADLRDAPASSAARAA